eukprot:6052309-Amphidinium_carterae.1
MLRHVAKGRRSGAGWVKKMNLEAEQPHEIGEEDEQPEDEQPEVGEEEDEQPHPHEVGKDE